MYINYCIVIMQLMGECSLDKIEKYRKLKSYKADFDSRAWQNGGFKLFKKIPGSYPLIKFDINISLLGSAKDFCSSDSKSF